MMHEMSENIERINLDTYELATTVGTHDRESGSFKVHINKLMPHISGASPTTGKIDSCKSALVNDSECKPSMSSTVETKNYMTFPRLPNSSFTKSTENLIPDTTIFNKGTRSILLFPQSNIREGFCFEFF